MGGGRGGGGRGGKQGVDVTEQGVDKGWMVLGLGIRLGLGRGGHGVAGEATPRPPLPPLSPL